MRPSTGDGLRPTAALPTSTARELSSNSMTRARGAVGSRAVVRRDHRRGRRSGPGLEIGSVVGPAFGPVSGSALVSVPLARASAGAPAVPASSPAPVPALDACDDARRSARRPERGSVTAGWSGSGSARLCREMPPRSSGSGVPHLRHLVSAADAAAAQATHVPVMTVRSGSLPASVSGSPSALIACMIADGCTANSCIRFPSCSSSRIARARVCARRVHRATTAASAASRSSAEISAGVELHDSMPPPLASRRAVTRGHVGTASPGSGRRLVRLPAIRSSPRARRGTEADRRVRRRRALRSEGGSRWTGRLYP